MTTISRVTDGGPAVIIVSAAHVIAEDSSTIEFEVLEADAASLESYIGQKQLLAANASTFWGELVSLEPCTSTAPGLGMLRHKPTFHGVIRKFSGEPSAVQ